MKCETCIYFEPETEYSEVGVCFRYPPREDDIIFPGDIKACGEYKPKEKEDEDR